MSKEVQYIISIIYEKKKVRYIIIIIYEVPTLEFMIAAVIVAAHMGAWPLACQFVTTG